MTVDPYAHFDGAYLLGALDTDERLAYEAHLASCWRCQAGLDEISAIPSLLAGLDESDFAAPPRRRWLTTSLGLLAAACVIALIVLVLPSSSAPKSTPWAMTALAPSPVEATITLQPRSWGTEIDLTCWYQRGAIESSSDRYLLVAHGEDGATYDLGSWRLVPGRRVIFTSGTALAETQLKNLQITQPNGLAILAFRVPRSLGHRP